MSNLVHGKVLIVIIITSHYYWSNFNDFKNVQFSVTSSRYCVLFRDCPLWYSRLYHLNVGNNTTSFEVLTSKVIAKVACK